MVRTAEQVGALTRKHAQYIEETDVVALEYNGTLVGMKGMESAGMVLYNSSVWSSASV